MSIPISIGSGAASVAAEVVAGLQYQRIEVLGQGGTSVMAVNPDGSINVSVIGAINVTGSIFAAGNQSISGTVGASVIGWVPAQLSNTSVITVWQDSSVIARVTGSVVAIPTLNQSVSGTVGASVIGWVPIQPSNTSTIGIFQNSSIIGINAGSVVTISQGSVIAVLQSSSLIAVNAGSVVAIPVGSTISVWQSPSIVGTYVEDAASASGDKGIFVLGVRNDTLSSMTSADLDYSSHVVGPAGEMITANAPLTKWIQGTADLRVVLGASVTAIAAQGASIFTYITGVQVVNFGSASVLVTLGGGLGSILGYTIAPAGGGSNIVYSNALKTGANSAFTASINGVASVLVSAQGFVAKI